MSWDFDPFPSLSKRLRSLTRSRADDDGLELIDMESGGGKEIPDQRKKIRGKKKKKRRRRRKKKRKRDGLVDMFARCIKREILDMICSSQWGLRKTCAVYFKRIFFVAAFMFLGIGKNGQFAHVGSHHVPPNTTKLPRSGNNACV